jgi:hypothetical protein
MNNIQFSKCLCKCYISFNEQYPVLKIFVCVDASLHDSLQNKKKKKSNVNTTNNIWQYGHL